MPWDRETPFKMEEGAGYTAPHDEGSGGGGNGGGGVGGGGAGSISTLRRALQGGCTLVIIAVVSCLIHRSVLESTGTTVVSVWC